MAAFPARAVSERGYAMVALLVAISIMSIALSVALPTWSTMAKREREAELIFRGEQYARAIAMYQRRFGNAFPPSVDVLIQQKVLRKRYRDPMTDDGEFQLILVGQPIPGQATAAVGSQPGAAGARSTPDGGLAPRGGAPQSGLGQQPVQGGMPQAAAGRLGGQAPGRIGGTVGGGIMGVVSRSTQTSLRLYNGRNKYSEWAFMATAATTQAGAPNRGQPPGTTDLGRRGRGGRFGTPSPQIQPPSRRGSPFITPRGN